jgi:2'-5' RNA ligase
VRIGRERTAVCVPVPEADHALRQWRSTYTVDGREGLGAHITLLYPFAESEEAAAELDRLRTHFAQQSPFDFALIEPRRFEGGVLYLAPEPAEPFLKLAKTVQALYPDRPPYGGAYADLTPHCTVADAEDEVLAVAEAAVRRHLPIEAVAIEAWLVEYVREGWSVRARLPFER